MKKFIVTALIGATALGVFSLTSCFKKNSGDAELQCQHEYCDEIILTTPTCGKDGSQILICTDCAHSEIVKIPATNEHSYIKKQVIEPTCKDKGYSLYVCDCGDVRKDDYMDEIDHLYESKEILKNPTCTQSGEERLVCSFCNEQKVESIDKIDHIYDQQVVTDNYLVSDATCTSKAMYNYSCICGDKGVETFEYGEFIDHPYEITIGEIEGTHIKVCEIDPSHTDIENCSGGDATCSSKAICEKCGAEYGSLKGHEYESNVIKDSTCSENGIKEFTCKGCGHSYQEDIPLIEHSYKLFSEQEANCFKAQGSTYKCINCEESYSTYTATNESAPEVTYKTFLHDETNLAYPDVGRVFTVKYPKTIVMEIGSKVNIDFETDLTSDPAYQLLYLNSSYNYLEIQGNAVVAHTNTSQEYVQLGLKFYHIEDDWIFYLIDVEVIDGHSYEEKSISKEPTCTEMGKMLCEFSACGDIEYKDIPTIDHSYENEVTQNPTCCKEGIQNSTCTICGYQTQTSVPKVYPQIEGVEVEIDTDLSKVYKLSELKQIFGDKWTHVQFLDTNGKCFFVCSECGENIILTYTED